MTLPKLPKHKLALALDLNAIVSRQPNLSPRSLARFTADYRNHMAGHHITTPVMQAFRQAEQHFLSGHSRQEEFEETVAVLLTFADPLTTGSLRQGHATQLWNPSRHGWHPWLNLMVSVARTRPLPFTGMDSYSLRKLGGIPGKLFPELEGWVKATRNQDPGSLPIIHTGDSIIVDGNAKQLRPETRLAWRGAGDFAFLYEDRKIGRRLALCLIPKPDDELEVTISWKSHPHIERELYKARHFAGNTAGSAAYQLQLHLHQLLPA